MNNIPEVKLGLVAVSRSCFPVELSKKRREEVVKECKRKKIALTCINTVIISENDITPALSELAKKGCNALVVYLGNFGPETPETILIQKFNGPVMVAGAAEETGKDLINGRGDAYCGMLNLSYNLNLRHLRPYIPESPVGLPAEVADMIADFTSIARVIIGVKKLKIFSFGPRPQDFLACNAPVKQLYDLGVEIMENSELDMYDIFLKAKDRPEVKETAKDIARELGKKNVYPELVIKQAQFEVALKNFMKENLGTSEFGVFANKCWPAFEEYFGFVPCFNNSRLAAQGIPVSCEVDIYGVLSEYMANVATEYPVTLLDINNTVPYDMYKAAGKKVSGYAPRDLFMGFHCGNTASCLLDGWDLKYQLIMKRLLEPKTEPNITRGTLEGKLKSGPVTIFRLQGAVEGDLRSYIAEGEVLDIDPKSFGSIGVLAIKEMDRFYRHVLIGRQYPHHTAVAFKRCGKILFEAAKMLGVSEVSTPLPKGVLYKGENAFK